MSNEVQLVKIMGSRRTWRTLDGTEHFDLSFYIFTGEAAEEAQRIEDTQRLHRTSLWSRFRDMFEPVPNH
ncbi:hypothetical protein [Mesorhizobium sp.]|uniref:hypothetical protein n=1 Tax=Mesorhizobium sp. TaxID=1871066 RepID=UPI000FE699DC|nr:hypothetical protein [Mesorhizobium sp.]RWP37070.1 MAG: hypothetical protein EOR03_06955 [Mesorhizobium sp.]